MIHSRKSKQGEEEEQEKEEEEHQQQKYNVFDVALSDHVYLK